jgi:AhpD family alkylhydroperoxidase
MTQRINYAGAAPGGMKALRSVYGYVAQSGLPATLIELVYLRVSQINGCAYRINMGSLAFATRVTSPHITAEICPEAAYEAAGCAREAAQFDTNRCRNNSALSRRKPSSQASRGTA